MSLRSTVKGAVLSSLLVVPSVVHAEVTAEANCWRAEEVEPARFEDFRLKLLIGALNCKNYLPGAASSYNNFLQEKKELVLANLYVVRAHFIREAGTANGADQFANYETLAGNRYSSPIFDRAKCETIDSYLKLAATFSDADLVKMVAILSPGPLPSGCKVVASAAQVAVVASPAAPAAPVSPAAVALDVPITDAQRLAMSTAATRQLIASRASLSRPEAAPTSVEVASVAPVAAAPLTARDPGMIPATLLMVDTKPVTEAQPAAPKPAKADVAVERVKPDAAAKPAIAATASIPPGAAQALADAARALAAAAAAMQPGTH